MLEVDSSGVKNATGNLQKFIEMTNKSAKSATDLEKKTLTLDDVMGLFNMSVIANAAGVMGLIKAVKGLANAFKGMINNYAHFESMQKNLETFFQSADLGKEKFEELRKLSNQTTFGVDELANSFTQLANVGAPVDEINDQLTMLGDLSGGDKQKFAELVSVYSKILSVGKAGSMQLQQIATKGIPIYDMLKQMGIEGTASAEDITEAFKKMTEQGGQFYNAMNNINDTIEGKEGFIKDYFKEFTVNFVEVSGLADTYKSILDTLKKVIGDVSDKLLEINKNPILKAIFQGIFVSSIIAIGTAILTSIIPVLLKVISHLTTINLLSGPKGWAVLAVAGIAGVTTAVVSLINHEKDVNSELEEQIKKRRNLGQIKIPSLDANLEDKKNMLSVFQKDLKTYEQSISSSIGLNSFDDIQKRIDESQKLIDDYNKTSEKNKPWQVKSAEKRVSEYQKLLNESVDSAFYQGIKQNIEGLEKEISLQDKRNKNEEELSTLRPYSNILQQIDDYQKQLENINEMAKLQGVKSRTENNGVLTYEYDTLINIDPSYKQKIDNVKKYVQEQLSDLQIKLAVSEQTDWQKVLQKAFGFTDKEVANGATRGTIKSLEEFTNIYKNRENLYKQFAGATDYNELKFAQDYYEQIQSAFLTVLDSVRNGTYTGDEESLQEFSKAVINAREKLKELTGEGEEVKSYIEILNKKAKEALENKDYGSYAGYTAASSALQSVQGGDVGNFIEAYSTTGSAEVSAIYTVILALSKVVSSLEYFNDAINPIANMLETLKPVLRVVVDAVAIVTNLLSGFLKLLQPVWDWFDKVADGLESVLDSWLGSEEEVEEATSELVSQLESLNQAMYDQEEFYLEQKKKLLSDSYIDEVFKVNDMILTPQGKFMTSPDDYLIATKNPYSLNQNGSQGVTYLQPIVNNTVSDSVNVSISQEQDSKNLNKLIVTISKKVASDASRGVNGWDSALSSRQLRLQGRGVLS